jgi:hypothetical protein
MSRESRAARDEKLAAWLLANRVVVYALGGMAILVAFVLEATMRMYGIESTALRLPTYFLGPLGVVAVAMTKSAASRQLQTAEELPDR